MRPHHTICQQFATLSEKDRATEWWTVFDEDTLYTLRDKIPFANLMAHGNRGGFVIYLDKPRLSVNGAFDALLAASKLALSVIEAMPYTPSISKESRAQDALVDAIKLAEAIETT